jgi:hypothetical protein
VEVVKKKLSRRESLYSLADSRKRSMFRFLDAFETQCRGSALKIQHRCVFSAQKKILFLCGFWFVSHLD